MPIKADTLDIWNNSKSEAIVLAHLF